MIRNKTKDELIEMVYSLEVDNQNLRECSSIATKTLSELGGLYGRYIPSNNIFKRIIGYVCMPLFFFKQLKKHTSFLTNYKLKSITMTQERVLEATEIINGFETKKVSIDDYRSFIESVIGVAVCKTCGHTTTRLHNDFQRRILNVIKKDYPFLAHPIKLTSSKYGSTYYNNTLPFYTFYYLNELLNKMKNDFVSYTKQGLNVAANEVKIDFDTLTAYIEHRSNYEHIEIHGVVSVEDVEANEVAVESMVSVEDTIEETEVTDWAYALELKKRGVHLKTIASELDVNYGGLSQILKDYEFSLIE